MTSDRELLVHVSGYAAIAAVLATAGWAGPSGPIFALPIVAGAIMFGAKMLVDRLVAQAQSGLEEGSPEAIAADGGTSPADELRADLVDALEEDDQ